MAREPRAAQDDVAPETMPETPPPRYAQPGHDFTLQAIMDMKGSHHELIAKVDRLISDVKSQGEKLDDLRHQASFIKGGIAASVFFVTVIVAVATFILNAKWDALLAAMKALTK